MCQITSNPYGDPRAVELTPHDFLEGGLRVISYARPGKLFTGHAQLMVSQVGSLEMQSLCEIVRSVVEMLEQGTVR